MAGGGGPAPPPKQEELQPHPVKDQLPNIAYCITSPPPWRQSLFYLFFFIFVYYGILNFYIYLVAHCYACYHPI
jgi:nucleobase transporter 1/2